MKKTVKIQNKNWIIAIAVMLVIIAVLTVLLVLEAKGVFYTASGDETVIITPPKKANGETHTEGDYTYVDLTDGTVMITYYAGRNEENVVVPTTLGGKQVSAIGEQAYAVSVSDARTITVGEGVTYIGESCFFGAEKATLYLPSTIKQIDDDALLAFDNPIAIYFAGTSEQWNEVKIGTGNKVLSIVSCTG